MNRTIKIIGFLAGFVLVNVAASFLPLRLDFTEGKFYSLSPSTHRLISEIPEPIEIKVFLSEKFPPQFMKFRQLFFDKLSEYKSLANGNLNISFLDPAKDEQAARLAQALGIIPVDLQVIQNDQMQVSKTYIGLAIMQPKKDAVADESNPLAQYVKIETIPFVQQIESLEYDIAALLIKITNAEQPTVGFLTGHGEHESAPLPQFRNVSEASARADYDIDQLLKKTYQVRSVDLSKADKDKDPLDGISTLVVAGPTQEIPEKETQKIHDFVARGGNVIFLLDGVTLGLPFSLTASALNVNQALLAPWGLKIEPKLVVDSSNVNAPFSQGTVTYFVPYPFFVKVLNLSKENPITRDLTSFVLSWVSPIAINKTEGVKVEVLASTSGHYALLEEAVSPVPAEGAEDNEEAQAVSEPINIQPQQSFDLRQEIEPVPLAVMAQKEGEGKIVAIGSSSFLSTGMAERPNVNLALLLNIADTLTLGDELIQIRSKDIIDRPIGNLGPLEKDLIQWGLILGLPMLFVGYGIFRRAMRNAKKKGMARA